MRVIPSQIGKEAAQSLANRPCLERTDARRDWHARRFRVRAGHFLGHIDQRPDQPEVAGTRPCHGGQCAQCAGEERIAQQGLAEVVGGVAERYYIATELRSDLVDRASPEAAARVTPMTGLLGQQLE